MSKKNQLSTKALLQQNSYMQLLENGGKVITMLSAMVSIAYAMGFVITNIHLLTKYGIYDFELVKTRYVMTGFFFLILTYIIFVISLVILKITETRSKKIAKIIIGIFSIIIFASFIGTFIKGITSWVVASYSEMGIISTFIRIWSFLTIVVIIAIILFIRKGGWKESGINIPIPYSIFTSALLIAGAYSQLVYPVLPIALGGGNPVPVQLIVENEEVKLIREVMPFADDVVTEEVFLIDQDSSTYFLLVPLSDGVHGKPIEIRKDYVAGIIHLTEANIPLLKIILPNNTSTITPTMQLTPTP